MGERKIADYASPFAEHKILQDRLIQVLESLPGDVLQDFFDDPTFEVRLENYQPGKGSSMFMALPTDATHVSRCVVLRQKLDRAPEGFALYVIAHEFAHAFLRNGGWGEITDKEDAADALALSWGYKKPRMRWF